MRKGRASNPPLAREKLNKRGPNRPRKGNLKYKKGDLENATNKDLSSSFIKSL
jgi:hypothetical protein